MATEFEKVKVVAVGDGAVGKTCLLITLQFNEFPEEYIPTVFDVSSMHLEEMGHAFDIAFWDTDNNSGFEVEKLRPLSYPQTDIILFCFSLSSLCSLQNVDTKWGPEVERYIPDAHRLLVGLKYAVPRDANIRCNCNGK